MARATTTAPRAPATAPRALGRSTTTVPRAPGGPRPEDFDACYTVLGSRDRRFDGCFFVAVTSTGIYCRPSCPAIVPKRRNVRFYPTAAAAQGAGFRACLRCHPHAVPGAPEWNLRGDLAGRAMGLIADGLVDREGVGGLARRLAYSERHLARQLTAELGAGPLALARAQRAQTARALIESSVLRLIDVAHAAGFSSVRQFNDTVRAVYGRTPTELRRRAAERARGALAAGGPGHAGPRARNAAAAAAGGGGPASARARNGAAACGAGSVAGPAEGGPGVGGLPIVVRLAYRAPLHWPWLLGFLGTRAVAGVEEVQGETYRRTLRLPHGCGVAELRAAEGHVECRLLLADLRDLTAAVHRCRRLLDLDADPAAPAEHLARDPLLAPLVRANPGVRLPGTVDGCELAGRAVLGQQVSVAAARTAAARLVRALGEPLPAEWRSPQVLGDSTLTHLFPAPAALAAADPATLPGGPARRRETLRTLAAALAAGDLELDPGADRAEVRARLLALPGVGPWTADYIAMRALSDPDAFLPTDVGVQRGLAGLGARAGRATRAQPGGPAVSRDDRLTAPEIARLAERWRPWRAYATLYLWSSEPAATAARGRGRAQPPARASGAGP